MTTPLKNPDGMDAAPFNMAALYYLRLSVLMEVKDKASIQGDVYTWYSGLRTIFRNIRFKLKQDEVDDLDKRFKAAKGWLTNTVSSGSVQQQINQIAMSKAADELDLLDSEIMIVMNKRSMIFPNIKIEGVEELKKRFNLK